MMSGQNVGGGQNGNYLDRKSVVWSKSVDVGGHGLIEGKNNRIGVGS